jgi:hypothetical protein
MKGTPMFKIYILVSVLMHGATSPVPFVGATPQGITYPSAEACEEDSTIQRKHVEAIVSDALKVNSYPGVVYGSEHRCVADGLPV